MKGPKHRFLFMREILLSICENHN